VLVEIARAVVEIERCAVVDHPQPVVPVQQVRVLRRAVDVGHQRVEPDDRRRKLGRRRRPGRRAERQRAREKVDAELARTEPDPEIQDLIRASADPLRGSAGLNLALDYLPGSVTFDPLMLEVAPELASRIVWFDAFVTNLDRTPRNTNLLVWHGRLWLIDHGAALYFHHDWRDFMDRANSPFALVKDHVLLPLASELADRRWRLILAGQIDEALAAMKASRIAPARIGGLRPGLLPKLLRLPDWLFRLVARRMLAIDPQARSSMWDDLQRGRPTEIGDLQGTVLSLAEKAGTPAPLLKRVTALVRQAERE
jgi:hypothetical protein